MGEEESRGCVRPSVCAALVLIGTVIVGATSTVCKSSLLHTQAAGADGVVKEFHHPWTLTLVLGLAESISGIIFLVGNRYTKHPTSSRSRRTSGTLEAMVSSKDSDHESDGSGDGEAEKQRLTGGQRKSSAGKVTPAIPSPRRDDSVNPWHFLVSPSPRKRGIVIPLESDKAQKETPLTFFLSIGVLKVGETVCGALGLTLGVNASIYQMFKGSSIIFTAFLSVVYLKRRLAVRHWWAVLVITLGLVVAAIASDLAKGPHGKKSTETNLIGLMFVFLGQGVHSMQVVVEEKFLKRHNVPPLEIVGKSGLAALGVVLAVIVPATSWMGLENWVDAAVQLTHSQQLAGFVSGYFLAVFIGSVLGISITKLFTGVHRTIINCFKTVLIWGVGVLMHHFSRSLGEEASYWTFVEFGGFGLLVVGTLLYNSTPAPLMPVRRRSDMTDDL